MLIGGEKYGMSLLNHDAEHLLTTYIACEACVRGHRVSNCQHAGMSLVLRCLVLRLVATCRIWLTNQCNTDRTLQHIAKKGRPVSQCTHCRTLRKSRSAHVKCDCGEKSHTKGTCVYVKEADPKGKLRLPCRLSTYSDTRHSRYLLLHPWRSMWLRS